MRARRGFIYVVLACLLGLSQAWGQSPTIQAIVGDADADTLHETLRVLTGETGSSQWGRGDTIFTRAYRMWDKRWAAAYLEGRLASFGLPAVRDTFVYTVPAHISGVNILAEQRGLRFPLQKYIVCAHYDDVAEDTHDTTAPGADDNASGVAAVLETARLLSRYQTDYTVLYALWDCEELGSFGSDAYATAARARGDSILGVVNLDMLGTDTNGDSLMDVAGGSLVPRARELGDTVAQLSQLYKLGLKPRLTFPGIEGSDHTSFARQKYPAILLTEYLADDSRFWHTSLDRVNTLNLPYYHRQAKLAVATIAFLAGVNHPSSAGETRDLPAAFRLEPNYPNPFNPSTTIRFDLPKDTRLKLTVYDILGREVAHLADGFHRAGYHTVTWNAQNAASGLYFARLTVVNELGKTVYTKTSKLLLTR